MEHHIVISRNTYHAVRRDILRKIHPMSHTMLRVSDTVDNVNCTSTHRLTLRRYGAESLIESNDQWMYIITCVEGQLSRQMSVLHISNGRQMMLYLIPVIMLIQPFTRITRFIAIRCQKFRRSRHMKTDETYRSWLLIIILFFSPYAASFCLALIIAVLNAR